MKHTRIYADTIGQIIKNDKIIGNIKLPKLVVFSDEDDMVNIALDYDDTDMEQENFRDSYINISLNREQAEQLVFLIQQILKR